MSSVSKNDKLALLGEFNARVGADSSSWNGIIGKLGIGRCNSNGHLLLQTCAEFNLLLTNTFSQLSTRYKNSWMHLRSKNLHQIDFVIVRARYRQNVKITQVKCGRESCTDPDSRLQNGTLHLGPKDAHRRQTTAVPKRQQTKT